MMNHWDIKYSGKEYAYGEEPNLFFKEVIDSLPMGTILLPGDGEGRNGVYAAVNGWRVESFDQSSQARSKALLLAQKNSIKLSYRVMDFEKISAYFAPESFSVIALLYFHVPLSVKEKYHKMLLPLLKPNGHLIFEGFSKEHIHNQQNKRAVGGPRDVDMLFSEEELLAHFEGLETMHLSQQEIMLFEGNGHHGESSIIRYIGKKSNGL